MVVCLNAILREFKNTCRFIYDFRPLNHDTVKVHICFLSTIINNLKNL